MAEIYAAFWILIGKGEGAAGGGDSIICIRCAYNKEKPMQKADIR